MEDILLAINKYLIYDQCGVTQCDKYESYESAKNIYENKILNLRNTLNKYLDFQLFGYEKLINVKNQ